MGIQTMSNGEQAHAAATGGGKEKRPLPERESWQGRFDFILSCVGFAVGLGNVWRFPYLCYKNGGGAFLIPYLICLVTGGVPMFFLEISLGQFMQQGGITVWNICPIFKGIGIGTAVVCFLLNIYYIIILTWALYFFAMSFTTLLPWSHCNNEWNTKRCFDPFSANMLGNVSANETGNWTDAEQLLAKPIDPAEEFWYNKVLQISPGIDDPGSLRWELALCLVATWIICYFCIWKGVKSTGKVVYFTATFPYVVLFILLIRGLTLDGAIDGIIYYLKPDFSKLGDSEVWIDAGTQIFFSYAIALGALTALGSYNPVHNDCYKDTIIIAVINSFTSLFSGFVIFSVLGFMAKEQNVHISQVAESGPGLAFIAYPKAITQMPVAPVWSVLFFFMIMLLGLDSQFVGVEGFVTAVIDTFPRYLRGGSRRELFIAVVSAISILLGLPMVFQNGLYVFYLWDHYAASGMTLLWFCLFESIAIAWVYGGSRFYDNIAFMIGYRINPWFRIAWTFLTPLVTTGILLFSIIRHTPLSIKTGAITYNYPAWAQGIGWCFGLVSMIQVPIYAAYALLTTRGSLRQRLVTLTTPILRLPHHQQGAPALPLNTSPYGVNASGKVVAMVNYSKVDSEPANSDAV